MLDVLGISPEDERIYRSLLRQPGISVAELGRAVGRRPESVQLALDRLEGSGLVTRVGGSGGVVPTRPDVAVDVLVARKQQELARVQAEARTLLAEVPSERASDPAEHLEIVRGREAVAHRFSLLEQTTQEELLVLDRPPYAQDAAVPNASELEMLERGVRCRGIYAPEAIEHPGSLEVLRQTVDAGEEARVHSALPLKLAISDRSAALLPLSGEQSTDSALVIHASTLLDALIALFELLWKSAVPLPGESEGGYDVDLHALMPAGLKDESIARQLAISPRTLSRRAYQLMADLDARTRFQCGILATRLGLLEDAGQWPRSR
jgi:sugar-specific transcriptional regulator TrmB